MKRQLAGVTKGLSCADSTCSGRESAVRHACFSAAYVLHDAAVLFTDILPAAGAGAKASSQPEEGDSS